MTKKDHLYMSIAVVVAAQSYAVRRKVGSVLVTQDGVLSIGYNGTVKGADNRCEDANGATKVECLHSESNTLAKTLQAGLSTKGATMYITLSPCIECAKLMYQAGIVRVVYKDKYRCSKGLDFLNGVDIMVEQFNEGD